MCHAQPAKSSRRRWSIKAAGQLLGCGRPGRAG
jgi:hypothetical protein